MIEAIISYFATRENREKPPYALAFQEAGIRSIDLNTPFGILFSDAAMQLRDCGTVKMRQNGIGILQTILSDPQTTKENLGQVYRLIGWYAERTTDTKGDDNYTVGQLYHEIPVQQAAIQLLIEDAAHRQDPELKILALQQLEKQLFHLELWERDWKVHRPAIDGVKKIASSFDTKPGHENQVRAQASRLLQKYLKDPRIVQALDQALSREPDSLIRPIFPNIYEYKRLSFNNSLFGIAQAAMNAF